MPNHLRRATDPARGVTRELLIRILKLRTSYQTNTCVLSSWQRCSLQPDLPDGHVDDGTRTHPGAGNKLAALIKKLSREAQMSSSLTQSVKFGG